MNTAASRSYTASAARCSTAWIFTRILCRCIDAIVRDSCTLQIADNADPMDWDVKGLGEYLEHVLPEARPGAAGV